MNKKKLLIQKEAGLFLNSVRLVLKFLQNPFQQPLFLKKREYHNLDLFGGDLLESPREFVVLNGYAPQPFLTLLSQPPQQNARQVVYLAEISSLTIYQRRSCHGQRAL